MMTKENLDDFIDGFRRMMNACRGTGVDHPIHSLQIHPVIMDAILNQLNGDVQRLASCRFSGNELTILGVKIDDNHFKDREIAELKSMLEAVFAARSINEISGVRDEYVTYCRRTK